MELTLDQALQKGVEAHKAGRVQEADRYYTAILKANPKHPDANHNMGVLAVGVGKVETALTFFKAALDANQSIAQYWLSYLDALIKLDRIKDAKDVFDQAKASGAKGDGFDQIEKGLGELTKDSEINNAAIKLQEPPEEQLKGLVVLHTHRQYQEALTEASQVLNQFPNSINLYNIIGAANKGLGKLDEAIEAYTKALSIKPNYAAAYYNLGNAFHDQGKLEEAIEAFTKAVSIKPDYAEAHNNMGIALKDQGKLEEAIEAFTKALLIKPDYAEVWNNLYFPLQAMKSKNNSDQNLNLFYPKGINSNYGKIQLDVLDYRLHRGQEDEWIYLDKALESLSSAENISIKNPTFDGKSQEQIQPLPDKMVALVHFGRSGTGLMHSLIDGHSEVSMLPSIYCSEYFDQSNWVKLVSDGWDRIVDRFVAAYEVLFDASSPVPVKSKNKRLLENIGIKEGMANVGDQRNEILRVDKVLFKEELMRLMASYNDLDAFLFFKLVHSAYNAAINDNNFKNLIFYHIHNPDIHAELNFVRFNPNANWLLMVREPIQCCESWIRGAFHEKNYSRVVNRISTMLFDIDKPIYSVQSSLGLRLEDIKKQPEQTIKAVCKWMGIKESESLYEMTAQGKKWWGDPYSIDYSKDGMEPFGKTSINRKIGSIFSENDQFILRTLFYPFSVRFGYTKENEEQFKGDLDTIRPMLDSLFDFERAIAEKMQMSCKKLIGSGSYLYLRSALIERWNILNKYQTYPNMIEPLKI